MRPLSYPNTDVFLVAFSIIMPASYENVWSKWYKELESQQAIDITSIPIILVGTKMDLRDDQGILAKLTEKGLVPVSFEQVCGAAVHGFPLQKRRAGGGGAMLALAA